MITALAIAAIVLTALLALSLPWFGWGPGIDAAGRGMAIFFPAILMGLRVSCLAVAAIVLAASGGLDWSGLHPVLSGLLAVLLVAGMGATSFFSVERLINAPRAGGRAGAAFLATIAAPMILVLWLLVERHGAGDPAQAWALRALVLAAALAPLPMLLRNERQRIAERRTQDADEARQDIGAARIGHEADLRERLDELGGTRSQNDIARKRDVGPGPGGHAVHSTNDGLVEPSDAADERVVEGLDGRAEVQRTFRVGAGGEILPGAEAAAGAGEQHGTAALIGGVVQRGRERAVHLLVEGIEAVGTIERQLRPAAMVRDGQHGFVHMRLHLVLPLQGSFGAS